MSADAQAIVVGAGLAGLVAASELLDLGYRVALVDQEPEQNLGAQAWWSFGGLFLVDSPGKRRLKVRDSLDLAWADWQRAAGFDRADDEDVWPMRWAERYVEWAAGEKRSWLKQLGISFFPVVGWAERGDGTSGGHGNSVPRFHIPWGTGTGVVAPFERTVREHNAAGRVIYRPRHRVDAPVRTSGAVTGVRGVGIGKPGGAGTPPAARAGKGRRRGWVAVGTKLSGGIAESSRRDTD